MIQNKINTKSLLALSAFVVLTGCSTTGQLVQKNQAVSATPKQTLETAIKSVLYSPFNYHTQIFVTNAKEREFLADQKNLAHGWIDTTSCEGKHDEAYRLLYAQGENADGFAQNKKKIDEEYSACTYTRNLGKVYQGYDFEQFSSQNKALSDEAIAQSFLESADDTIEKEFASDLSEMDGASKSPTQKDKKVANLLNEYLIKPSNIEIKGHYSPLGQSITALPQVTYDSKNLKIGVNQPVYLDLQKGAIYLWADNIANINRILDKELGLKWQNKWLYLPINDGSLPKDFQKDLIKTVLEARKQSFATLPDTAFTSVSADDFVIAYDDGRLPKNELKDVDTIISRNTDEKASDYANFIFLDYLLQEMTQKYPELLPSYDMNFERDIIDGESHVKVVNVNKKPAVDEKVAINSKYLMRILFVRLQEKVGEYYGNFHSDINTEPSKLSAKFRPTTSYGLKNGKISWISQSYTLGDTNTEQSANKVNHAFVFTKFYHNAGSMGEFDKLPNKFIKPTDSNSINLYDYKDELIKRATDTNVDPNNMLLMIARGVAQGVESINDDSMDKFEEDIVLPMPEDDDKNKQ